MMCNSETLEIILYLSLFYGLLFGIIGACVWANTVMPHPLWLIGIGITSITIIVTAIDFINELRQ